MKARSNLIVLLPLLALAVACTAENDEAPAETGANDPSTAGTDTAPAAARTPSAPGASVYFVTPSDGDVVSSPVTVKFGLQNMQVVPAGTEAANSGHHHLIVDAALPAMDAPIPADAHHIHFGDGSKETMLELEPGEHTLQLLLADHLHIPHKPPVASDVISITVE